MTKVNQTSNIRAMVIGTGTYGYFNEESNNFTCTHGAWDSEIEIVDDRVCRLFGKLVDYSILESVPKDYIR